MGELAILVEARPPRHFLDDVRDEPVPLFHILQAAIFAACMPSLDVLPVDHARGNQLHPEHDS